MITNSNISPEKGCQWHPIFRDANDNGVGPSEPMQENFRKTPYSSLVREAIQNSLDVVKDTSKPMEIHFSIGSIDSRNFPNFFDIRQHIKGCIENFPNNDKARKIYPPMLSYIDNVTKPGGKMHFIRISDHNTLGMHYDNPDDNDAPFYAFVRSAGVSSKSNDSAGGSYGFGKAAYFYLSPIRTILVSTKTDKGDYYFEGVSSLCSHKVNGHTVSNIVYYDNNGGKPTTDYNNIPGRFQRKDSDYNEYGSGTDIFIMGIDFDNYGNKEEMYEQMFTSVLENFWLAILERKLIVKIGERYINSENITSLMYSSYEATDTKMRKSYNPRPYFDAVKLANTSNKYIHRVYDLNTSEKLLEIGSKDWGEVHYYFHIDKNAKNRIVYMRSLKMKVSISAGRNGEGYYGVILCPNGACNTILRQIEDPAHSSWDANRLENRNEKRIAKTLISVIEEEKDKIIREIFNLDNIETVKIKGLEQYLYISSETDDDNDDDAASSLSGVPTGTFLNDGYSPTTTTAEIKKMPSSSSETLQGKILINTTDSIEPNSQGTVLTGRGNRTIKKPHTNNHVSASKPRDPNERTTGETKTNLLEPVLVKYRSFAQTKGSKIVHKLIIHAPHDIENGQIDLLVGGESSDSKISIQSSTDGDVSGNSIVNLILPEGRNEIEICFADNLQHSIKLEAYEVK